jgi:glycolate oxidase iron-sulfur subunit
MKEYGELLADDPEYAQRAREFARRVKDISEFLVALPLDKPTGHVDSPVTYQDPCHLAHAQRISEAPRTILRSIPGVSLVEMPDAARCCGSAGVYGLTQPGMSAQLLASKMAAVEATQAPVIATANPGCMAQLEAGVRRTGSRARVVHVVELLDQAYRSQPNS